MTLRRRLLQFLSSRPRLGSALLLAPGSAWLLFFFLVPLLIMLAWSVMPMATAGRYVPGFTLEHYLRFLDPLYLSILWRTIWLAALTTLACLLLGFPTAWAVARSGRYRTLLLFLAVLPFWTSALVRTYAMMFLLRDSGLVNRLLLELGLISTPIRMLYTDGAVLAIHKIVTGLAWKEVQPPVTTTHDVTEDVRAQCVELGQTMAAGLEMGVF